MKTEYKVDGSLWNYHNQQKIDASILVHSWKGLPPNARGLLGTCLRKKRAEKKSPQFEASSCPNVHCQYMHIMTSNHPLEMDIAQKHQASRSIWTVVIEIHFTRGFCFHCCLDGQNCSLSHNKKEHGYELGFCQRRGFEGARGCVWIFFGYQTFPLVLWQL